MKITNYLKKSLLNNCFVAMDDDGKWWCYDYKPARNKLKKAWYVQIGYQHPLPNYIEPVKHWDRSLRLIGEEPKLYTYNQLDNLQEAKGKIIDCSGDKVVFANGEVWKPFDSSRLWKKNSVLEENKKLKEKIEEQINDCC